MVLLPFMAWGNLKLFLRQCKLAEANNPQVKLDSEFICWSSQLPRKYRKIQVGAMFNAIQRHYEALKKLIIRDSDCNCQV